MDYRRTEFHGIYVYNRTRPPYNDTLFLQFRYLGELHNDLLIDHHLVATSPIDPFTYRNTGGHAIVAQVTTEDVAWVHVHAWTTRTHCTHESVQSYNVQCMEEVKGTVPKQFRTCKQGIAPPSNKDCH